MLTLLYDSGANSVHTMETVQEILAQLDVQSVAKMDVNESYTIEVPQYNDLTIEKVDKRQLSIAHHYVQRCDLMCDPEVVFRIENGNWIPIEYTQHPRIYQRDEAGLELDGFLEHWNQNLRQQGFVDAVET